MRYAGIIKNDFASAPKTCLTFFTQGCPYRCKGCHNPETWDFDGGKEFTPDTMADIIKSISANGIMRDLCVMGGEPLCDENVFLTAMVISEVKAAYPDIKVYIWTGNTFEHLIKSNTTRIDNILKSADYLIDGPYEEAERDITLFMRGSRNQRVIDLKETFKQGKLVVCY